MSKFKVGDKIICPKDRRGEKSSEGIVFVQPMSRYVGDVMEITSIAENGGLCANGWVWAPAWVELAEDRFKIEPGDYVEISGLTKEQIYEIIEAFEAAGGINKGDIDDSLPYLLFDCRDKEIWTRPDTDTNGARRQITVSDLIEDRTNWHPHHDAIVAWAKGAKIEFRDRPAISEWSRAPSPSWDRNIEYRIKPEPDHTAEIAEIERKMRELSESQKELADRLEKLK